MLIETIADFRAAMRSGPYAWPGGYPRYFVLSDGEALSFAAARNNIREILEALVDYRTMGENEDSGWRPVGVEINWEDNDLTCAHSGELIECACPPDDDTDMAARHDREQEELTAEEAFREANRDQSEDAQ